MHANFLKVIHGDIRRVLSADLPWHELAGSRIVITGAAGFLGGGLIRALLALHSAGHVQKPIEVVALVRKRTRAMQSLADIASDPQLQWIEWDLNTLAIPDLGCPDFIIHAASQASPKFYSTDPVGTLLPNAVGTTGLLQASRGARRFLFISSCEVYGIHSSHHPLSETDFGSLDPANVRSCYAESKRLGEALCVAWHAQYGMHISIVRPFHTYGPGLKSDDGRVFSDFAHAIAQGRPIVLTSDGKARRAFCYASDATIGILTVLLNGEPAQPYNLGNPEEDRSVLELATLLCENFRDKGARLEFQPPAAGYLPSAVSHIVPDISRLRALGWRPDIGVLEGFNRFIEAISP